MKKPVVLCIMDGFGHNPSDYGNAIKAANTPRLDEFMKNDPMTYIGASGMDVGLPDGQMGNSEVGHTNIGAGRIVYQMLVKISKDINDGKIYENKALSDAMDAAKANGKSLHLMGLLSNGGVHSHNEHLYGLLKMAKKKGIENVYVHTFLDGRDVPPTSGAEFMAELEKEIKELKSETSSYMKKRQKNELTVAGLTVLFTAFVRSSFDKDAFIEENGEERFVCEVAGK